MKLYPIVKLIRKWDFEYKYLQKLGFEVQTTYSEPAYFIEDEKVNNYTYYLKPIDNIKGKEIEAVDNFFKENLKAFKQLKNYEYTVHLIFIFDCVGFDYPEATTIQKNPRLEKMEEELGISITINIINPDLLENDLIIEVNWKESNLETWS